MRLETPHARLAPEPHRALLALNQLVVDGPLEPKLVQLVYLRASQINRCARCIDVHTFEALAGGDDVQRLAALPAWRDADFFSARERAALAWCEALTDLHDAPSKAAEALVREAFGELEIVMLTYAVAVINAWNRLGIGCGAPPVRRTD